MAGPRIPIASYRLQFFAGFQFSDAENVVPYLEDLGVTDVYSSPLLKSRFGSIHGYDVTDHSQIDGELGGEEAFCQFSDRLRERDMGLILDVVPNHMEIDDPSNTWWQDVLENGPGSQYAGHFDIDWDPPKLHLKNRVLLPVLGDQFGKVLENGEIRLFYADGAFAVAYYEHRFPIDPRTAAAVLETVAEHVRFTSEPDSPDLVELESILTSLRHLPKRTEQDTDALNERRRETQVAKRRLASLTESSATVRRAIEGVVVDWSGRPGEPESFDRLEQLLARQAYRLSDWRVAADEINYRRFFDINDLAAIRVEDPTVFAAVHDVLLHQVGEGRVTGVRIDHPDGLYDPEHYFATLQSECGRVAPAGDHAASRVTAHTAECSIYAVAEKILSRNEQLPIEWAVHGTSGYEMLNLINGLFVDPEGEQPLLDLYSEVAGISSPSRSQPKAEESVDQPESPPRPFSAAVGGYEDLVYQCKKVILKVSMSSELHMLARRLDAVSEQHRWSRDFTLWGLHEALREVIACFPVYRTYVTPTTVELTEEERRQVQFAVQSAIRRNPAIDRSIFEFIRSVVMLENFEGLTDEQAHRRREFVSKFQQLTGPVMAKGWEDTAFYRVFPLASLNEVGGEPEHFSVSLDEFHRQNTVRCARWPYGMVALSTHDTKRSEDVRAWINVLSETPKPWSEAVARWREMNAGKKTILEGVPVPDANEEYLLYQTLIGTWPLNETTEPEHLEFVERIGGYMEKALREAKVHTSWVSPDADYEQAMLKFVRGVLTHDPENAFPEDFANFRRRFSLPGLCNALAQVVLKNTVPGVPDMYQGCELWNFCLVDPDNRQPVDYEHRRQLLASLKEPENGLDWLIGDMLENWRDGRVKLFTTHRSLNFRRDHRDVFLDGDYLAPEVSGEKAEHACAFIRRTVGKSVFVAVPRCTLRLTEGDGLPLGGEVWRDTAVIVPPDTPAQWRNVFTGEVVEIISEGAERKLYLADALKTFPVALLESVS